MAFACGDDDDAPADNTKGGSAGSATAGDNSGGDDGVAGTPSGGKGGTGGTATAGSGGDPNVGVGGEAAGGAGGAGGQGGEAPVCELLGEGGAGGAGGEGPGLGAGLEIIGSWQEEAFEGTLDITARLWNDSVIREFDNDENVVYAQNSCAAFFPAAFSKYVYTEPANDSFYYCTTVYDAATLEAAKASDAEADAQDLEHGCSGFPWSKVSKP
jgi:hypothetical protein